MAIAVLLAVPARAQDATRTPGPAPSAQQAQGSEADLEPAVVPLGEVGAPSAEALAAPACGRVRGDEEARERGHGIDGAGYTADLDGGSVRVRFDLAADADTSDGSDSRAGAAGTRTMFTYRLARVTAGGHSLFDATAGGPAATGAPERTGGEAPGALGAILYRRARGLAERYEPRPTGIEQLFVIDDPLPAGADLVIEGVFAVELDDAPTDGSAAKPAALRIPGRGVIFALPGEGGARELLCYGEPTLIDAAGRAVPGELMLDANAATLTLAFSDAQLADLTYPIIVDPYIGSNVTIRATAEQERGAAIAFNSVRNEYLVVWEVQIGAGTDYDVWGQRVNATGTLLGTAFAIRNQVGVPERNPDVAYSPSTDRYVLAMEYMNGDVIQTTITWNGTYVGAWYLDNRRPPTGFSRDPKVVHQTADAFCFVWSDSDASVPQNQWLLCERRDSNALFVGSPINDDWIIQSTSGATALRRPSLAYNATEDDFYFAWEHVDGSARSVAITGDLVSYVGPSPNIILSSAGREPGVAWNSTANEYLVSWPDNVIFGPDYDLFTQRVHGGGALVGNKKGGVHATDVTGLDEREPATGYSSVADESLVVYHDAVSGTNRNIYARPLRPDGVNRGALMAINNLVYDSRSIAVAYGGGGANRFLCAWEDNRSGNYDIFGQLFSDTAPTVLETDPAYLDTNVPTDATVAVHFSEAMNPATITTSTIGITQSFIFFTPVPASVTYVAATRTAFIDPTTDLAPSSTYRIEVTTACQDNSGNGVPATPLFFRTFSTGTGPGLTDTDGDGLLDLEEARLGTNPNLADTDGDGMPDLFEVFATDALRADTDGDGDSDFTEVFINQTNPNDPTDGSNPNYDVTAPGIVGFSPSGGTTNVPTSARIYLSFDEPIDPASVVYGTDLRVENVTAIPPTLIAGSVAWQNGNRTLRFTPSAALPSGVTIQTTALGGAGGIADPAGNPLPGTVLSSFTTASSGPPAPAAQEPLHHPSFGESNAAGQMGRQHGDGGVPGAPSDGLPVAFYSPSGVGEGCGGGCESGCGGPRTPSAGGSGVGIFPGNRTAVTLHNGAFLHQRVDWAHSDRSLDMFTFARTYRSNLVDPGTGLAFVGLFGLRTVSNWETRLIGFAPATSFTLLAPDGRFFSFTWTGSAWAPPTGFFARVYHDTVNAEAKLIFRNGLIYAYHTSGGASGRLKYVQDRNGQRWTPAYFGSTITSVTDATGRVMALGYTSGRITSLTSYDGLVTGYGYDGSGQLISVTLPPTDEFPTGRQEIYTYAAAGTALLESLTNGRGETYLTNRYEPVLGIVESQDHIAGTHHYLYELGYPGGVRTSLVDRMGHVSEVIHDSAGRPVTITQYSNGVNELDPTSQWVTAYAHSAAGQITKVVLPRGNVHQWTYDANGFVTEHRKKTADVADNDAVDMIERWKTDPAFGVVLRYLEPRANVPGLPAADKVALARLSFYDHEDISTRLATEATELGATVTVAGNAPVTWGRTGAGQFPAKAGTVFNDNDGDGLLDRGGNLWLDKGPSPKVVDRTNPSTFLATRQAIEQFVAYNEPGQPILEVDAGGDLHRWEYYSGAYNLTTYPNAGFLRFRIVDSGLTAANLDLATGDPTGGAAEPNGHLALTTTYAYDLRGNVTSVRSPRGVGRTDDVFHTRMTYDQNNLLRSRTVSAPFNYQSARFYDGNLKVVEERTPNVLPQDWNGNGIQDGASEQATGSPAWFSTAYTYCVCNDVDSVTTDAFGLALITFYDYDLNQRRISTRRPEGQLDTVEYDERDLPFRTTRGANDTAQSSTARSLYDANGNLSASHDDDLDVDAGDTATTFVYDLFDRQTKVIDELGNESETVYDVASFARRSIFRGPDGGGGGNEILAQRFMEYDDAGRLFQTDADHFDAVGNVALAAGPLSPPVNNTALARGNLVSAVTVYDAEGHVLSTIDDNLHETQMIYDHADRVIQTTDARGNVTVTTYDPEGHAIAAHETEVADVGSNLTFVNRSFVDELGRPRVRMSPLGNAVRTLYDSRGLLRQTSDAQADNAGLASTLDTYAEHLFNGSYADIQVSGAGNRIIHDYDGAGRLTTTTRNLTSDGSGNGSAIDTIVTTREYDLASRLTGQVDDNGNRTQYGYDLLDRRVAVLNADSTLKLFIYDRAGNLRYTKDERGVVTTMTVDRLGRTTQTAVDRLPFGPGQTSYETFAYDGASRMIRGENNHAIVELRYDSLGPVIREQQTINVGADRAAQADPWPSTVVKAVTSSYDGLGNRTQLAYPGGTVVNETYDVLDRPKLVKDGSTTIAEYMYAGSGSRVLEKRLPLALTTLYRAYDNDRRVTRHDQRRTTDSMRLAGFSYGWDRVGNRWYERTLTNNTNPSEAGGAGEAFAYDSAYRMLDSFEGVASGQLDLLANNTPRYGTSISATTLRRYSLDGVGNRTEHLANGVVEDAYTLEGDDASTNQYTLIDDTFQSYDASGNLLHDGTRRFAYDHRNQLIRAVTGLGGSNDTRYRHDVLGRRISKRTVSGNFPGLAYGHAVYVQSGTEILEETDTAGVRRKEWIYGIRIDEPLRQRAPDYADLDNDLNLTELVDLYYLTNSLGSVTALVRTTGAVAERYVMDVWGTIRDVIDKNGASTGAAWTKVGNPWVFTGRQFDFEERTGLYHFRARAYRPATSSFMQRDPVAGLSYPRLHEYVDANPANGTDPSGLLTVRLVDHTAIPDRTPDYRFVVQFTADRPRPRVLVQQVRRWFVIRDLRTGRVKDWGSYSYAEWFRVRIDGMTEVQRARVLQGHDPATREPIFGRATVDVHSAMFELVGDCDIVREERRFEIGPADLTVGGVVTPHSSNAHGDFGFLSGGQHRVGSGASVSNMSNDAFQAGVGRFESFRRTGSVHRWGYRYVFTPSFERLQFHGVSNRTAL